jgi:hypothetical protein
MRFYLKYIPLCITIFLLLAMAARALGGTQPPNDAFKGFVEGCEDKPQPCWYGVVPGTSREKLREVFQRFDCHATSNYLDARRRNVVAVSCADGQWIPKIVYALDYSISKDNPTVAFLAITLRTGNVGDLAAIVGGPTHLEVSDSHLWLSFADGVYRRIGSANKKLEWFGLDSEVALIFLYAPGQRDETDFSPWHGFAPGWRYCQLDGALPPFVCQTF